jgi:anti-sigma regulatory factor (Ser/Thr protein kinase)
MNADAHLTGPARPAGPAGPAAVRFDRGAPARPILDEPFDSGTLHALRADTHAQACRAGLPEDRAVDAMLAVHELAANAVVHGAGRGRLRLWDLAGSLCCEIAEGNPPDAAGAARDPWPVADGHGLWLVHQVADQVEVVSSPQGSRVLVTFAPPPLIRPPGG